VQRMSFVSAVSWSLGLTLLAYAAFLIREVLLTGPQRAIGVGIFPKVLYNPWFWATAILLSVLFYFWKYGR
jgi:hypothetical protein